MKGCGGSRDCLMKGIVELSDVVNLGNMFGREGGRAMSRDRLWGGRPIPGWDRRLGSGQDVRGASDTFPSPVQDMRVDHRCADVFMSQQLLDRPDIVPVFEQVSRKRMPQAVTGDML